MSILKNTGFGTVKTENQAIECQLINGQIYFGSRLVNVVRKARYRKMSLYLKAHEPIRLVTSVSSKTEEILKFISKNKSWLLKNLSKLTEIEQKYKYPLLKQSELFPFLGELKYLQFQIHKKNKIEFKIEEGFLICSMSFQTSQISELQYQKIWNSLLSFYKKEALKYLQEKVDQWIQETGLQPVQLNFRRPVTRWGSCSSKKHITLNWKLICHSPKLIEYVIIHELCHLKYMNHSNQFWSLVELYMPEYLIYEKSLQDCERLSAFLSLNQPVLK